MKKALVLLFAVLVALPFAACSNTYDDKSSSTTTTNGGTSKAVIIAEDSTAAAPETTAAQARPTDIGDSSIAAVGIVDEAAGTATVLGENGGIATVKYTGDAPGAGGLYALVKSGDSYTFTEVSFINGSPLSDPAWGIRLWDNTDSGSADTINTYDTMDHFYDFVDDTVVFIRYSATEWRLITGTDLVHMSDWPCYAYFAVNEDVASGNPEVIAVLVGGFQDGAIVSATEADSAFFDVDNWGWSSGDIVIK